MGHGKKGVEGTEKRENGGRKVVKIDGNDERRVS